MSRSRAATPAGRRRSSARTGSRGSSAPAKPRKRAAKPRAASGRAGVARRPAKRTAAKRRPARRARARAPRRRGSAKHGLLGRLAGARARRARGSISWRYRIAILGLLAAVLAAAYMLVLRDSSLVAIDDVEVVGVTSGERAEIVTELTAVAEQMTTLHVDSERLEQAAAAFPTIESVKLDPNFPHGLRIEVTERPPRMLVKAGGRQVPVAADGTLLDGVSVDEDEPLPALELDQLPPAGKLSGKPLEQALVVGAAPEPLRPLIEKLGHDDALGVVITMRGGIPVRFGSGMRAAEKWGAAAAVLADPKLDALTYLDVRVPERPAAGGAAAPTETEPEA